MEGHAGHLMAAGQQLDAWLLLGAGLAMSFGHWLGMCGPLVAPLAAAQRQQGMSLRGVTGAHLLRHAGRITSYAMIGVVFALASSAVAPRQRRGAPEPGCRSS